MNPSSRIGNFAALALAFAAGMAVLLPASRAQDNTPTVAASLVDPAVDAGQPAEYHISVVNTRLDHAPPAPVVDGLSIAYSGESQSRQFSVGSGFQMRQTVTTTYVYSIETNRPGRFTIPGQEIEANGTNLRALPITLTVLDAGGPGGRPRGETVAAELVVSKKSAYIGESVPAEVRAYFGLNVRYNVGPEPDLHGEGFSAQKFSRPRTETQVIEGAQVQAVTFRTAITGVKTGNLTVGPAQLESVVQMPLSQRRLRDLNLPIGDPNMAAMMQRFYVGPQQRVELSTQPVNIEIKPLPTGKPPDFSGAIGDFKLEAQADPRKAQAGDPVTVRLVLSGRGNFDRIAAPVPSDEHGLRTYPATSKFKADDEAGQSGVKTFEQVVIADGARSSLPPYHFSYLDPAKGKYVAIDTPPIPVEIAGGSTPVPVAAATTAGTFPTVTPTPSRPPPPAEDILYIRADAGSPATLADFLPTYRRRSFWVVQGAALALLLGLAAFGGARARARNEKARRLTQIHRQKMELQRALNREDTGRGEFYQAATQLARLKAATVAGLPEGSLSVADICRTNGLDPQATGSMEQIFYRHDELAYSGGRVAQEPVPPDERRSVLATLETLEKR